MEKTVMFFYDKDGDIMDISFGKPKIAISEEVNDDIVVRLDSDSKEVIGFTIINFVSVFLKRFATKREPIEIKL